MFRLIYASTARELMSMESLLEILAKARDESARLCPTPNRRRCRASSPTGNSTSSAALPVRIWRSAWTC